MDIVSRETGKVVRTEPDRKAGRPQLPRDEGGKLLGGVPLLRGFDAGPPIHRFDMPDQQDMGQWLYERLREKYLHLNERTYPGWIRGWMVSNDFLFIRTADAVALFERFNVPFDPRPAARELFAYQRQDVPVEMEALYEYFEIWCRNQGVGYIECARDTDFPVKHIKDVILCLRNRTVVSGEMDLTAMPA